MNAKMFGNGYGTFMERNIARRFHANGTSSTTHVTQNANGVNG